VRAAKRRYHKGSKKRARAIHRCHKRYGHKRRAKRSDAVGGSQIAPFASTGCAAGQWPFEAQVKFKNGAPDDRLDQSVGCAPAGGTPPSGGGGGLGGGGCGLPICLPLPLAAEQREVPSAWR
jgi:hypothetical protein